MANVAISTDRNNCLRYLDGNRRFSTSSVFERLICLAVLANEPSDDEEGKQAVRAEHRAVFEDWLGRSLQEKQADLEACAADQERSASGIMREWVQPHHHRPLIPASAPAPQRELFELELEVLYMII
jgi:hypothetical protein